MAPVIVAAPSVRAMIYATLEADAGLLALLPNGAMSILPRQNMDPAKVARPFIYFRLEGVGGGGTDMDTATWAFEVHDRPGFGLWSIDRIIDRLRWLLNHKQWPHPTASMERPRNSHYAGASGEMPDDGWSTIKRIARFQIIQS